jgi:hypothetical protein
MNYRLNSYLSILAITCAVAVPLLSATARELPVQAALTAPASYDYSYQYSNWGEANTIFQYTQTADSTFFNYTSTAQLIDGLEVIHTFNRSNTDWEQVGSYWYPDDTKIGGNTAGAVQRINLTFENNTNKDYALYIDLSSNTSYSRSFFLNVNGNSLNHAPITTALNILYLHSNSTLIYQNTVSTSSTYFDAWYLKDLGVSASYEAGYHAGEDAGYIDGLENSQFLITAAESLIGMFVNFTFIIFTLEIFGVNILMIIGVLFGIVAITWILKTIRG